MIRLLFLSTFLLSSFFLLHTLSSRKNKANRKNIFYSGAWLWFLELQRSISQHIHSRSLFFLPLMDLSTGTLILKYGSVEKNNLFQNLKDCLEKLEARFFIIIMITEFTLREQLWIMKILCSHNFFKTSMALLDKIM